MTNRLESLDPGHTAASGTPMASSGVPTAASDCEGRKNNGTGDNYFWNFGLTAYDCPEYPRGNIVLRVKEFVGTRGVKPEFKAWPPVTPTEAELKPTTAYGIKKGLWVGIALPDGELYRTKSGGAKKKGKFRPSKENGRINKSVRDIIEGGNVELLQHSPKALRVVRDVDSNDNKLYTLANPDESGLCTAIQVDMEEVWFAPEYRDDTQRSIGAYRASVSQKITNACTMIANKKLTKTARPSIYTETIPALDVQAYARQVDRLVTEYLVMKDQTSLRKAAELLTDMSEEVKERARFRDHLVLDELVDPNRSITNETALCDAAAELFPVDDRPENLTTLDGPIRSLKGALKRDGRVLRYSQLRFIILDWSRKYRGHGKRLLEEQALAATELADTIQAMRSYHPTPSVSRFDPTSQLAMREPVVATIRLIVRDLQEIEGRYRAETTRLQRLAGPNLTNLDLKTIMERLRSAVDKDEMYKWANEALYCQMSELLKSHITSDDVLRGYIERLDGVILDSEEGEGELNKNDDGGYDEDEGLTETMEGVEI